MGRRSLASEVDSALTPTPLSTVVKRGLGSGELPVTLIPGDGIGREIAESVVGVFGGTYLCMAVLTYVHLFLLLLRSSRTAHSPWIALLIGWLYSWIDSFAYSWQLSVYLSSGRSLSVWATSPRTLICLPRLPEINFASRVCNHQSIMNRSLGQG